MVIKMAVYKLLHKLCGSRGETLIETLAAILIAALSVALLFSCVAASTMINKSAREADDGYVNAAGVHQDGRYDALSEAEKQETPSAAAQITVMGTATVSITVDFYGEKGLYSYREEP